MGFLQEVERERERVIKTLCLVGSNAALGLATGTIGPTLLDLQRQTRTDLRTISYLVTARTGGHAIGSVASELPFD